MLPWHRRLEARVALGVSLLIGGSLALLLFFANSIVRTNALNRAATDLQSARVAFYHLVEELGNSAGARLRLVTELPVFRAMLPNPDLAGDANTFFAMADEYRRALNANFLIVTNAAGTWLTNPGWQAYTRAPADITDAINVARDGTARRSIIAHDNHLYLIVSEPARFADEVLGTVLAGYLLDDAVARELALTTRREVSFLVGPHLSGSSLPPARQQALINLVRRDPDSLGRLDAGAELRSLAGARYVSGTYPMTADNTASVGRLVLLEDWQPTQTFVDQIRNGVLGAGAIMFLLALAGGLIVSRRMTRPLTDITRVTGEVAAGNWDRRVPVLGNDEIGALAASFNDMTASLSHWHTEAQSKTAELQDSYERFFSVAQSAADAIISTDASGHIRFWNLSAIRTFGYVEDEILGRPLESLFDAGSLDAYHSHLDALRRGEAVTQGMFEATGLRKDGTPFPIEVSLAIWMAGHAANFSAMIRDITERKRAESALRRSEAELRQAQKMEAIGRLAGGVAHDFNNLLTAIRGYAELLLDDLAEHDTRRDDAAQILKAAESAGALTRQLLAFSRKQILAPKTVNLGEIVRGMEKMLTRLIGEDVELSVHAEPNLWSVRADPGQIEQVVMNLALNARDAMPAGGHISIRVANAPASTTPSAEQGDRACMTVADTGSGIDAATLANIFEPFFTTKEEGRGTGLGLAMVDGIVEQSGGSITVESEVGRGTTFRVFLPRISDAAPGADTGGVPAREAGAVETILLVEDEPGVRRFANEVLTRQGYRVLEASCGDEALLHARRHPAAIHLLVTDVVMPGMSGRVLWEHLSALRPDTRVLFISGYTDDEVVRRGITTSELPYLQKPFSVTSLTEAVRRALTSERARTYSPREPRAESQEPS